MASRRLGRWLHPGAWWAWALCLAAAASRTTNPLLLVLLACASAVVVAARRPAAPWGRSYSFFLRLAAVVVVVRVAVQILFGAELGVTVLLPLPGIHLPDWLAGVRLGGDVTAESLLLALYDGMRLATILLCVGAANSLASPTRLLKSVPAALYEVGVSVVVALTFTPQLVTDVDRLRTMRRLRGRPDRGIAAIAGAAIPVLEGALERSVNLAAAMDSRGYGRRGEIGVGRRRMMAAVLLAGLVAACIGCYGLVSAGSPPALGLPMLALGVVASVASVLVSSRSSGRTTYRPDPWRLPETLVVGAGVAVVAAFVVAGLLGDAGLATSTDPPAWPALPLLPLVGVLLAATPALTAPPLPAGAAPVRQPAPDRVEVAA